MNLIIDGNYILYRNVFALFKDRLLYGYLMESLEKSIETYSKWYPFKNIYFISDSKTNWRKNVYPEYKANRKKSDDIDWEFVQQTYTEFKDGLSKRYKKMECELVEGDDWFYYLSKYHNNLNESTLMVSNDRDLTQLIETNGDTINIMVNESYKHDNIFLPTNYKIWNSNRHNSIPVPGLFDDYGDDFEELKFIEKLIDSRTVKEVSPDMVIFEKIVSGDAGDNIKTVWGKLDKSGKLRGLGIKSAEKLYSTYSEYFGQPKYDDECLDRITDLIIDFKKLEQSEFDAINDNVIFNNNLVNFKKIPDSIINRIKNVHESVNK